MRLLVGRAAVEGEIDVGGRLPDSRWFERRDDATIAPSEKRPMFDEERGSLFLILNQKVR
jgi:hypothetical protein